MYRILIIMALLVSLVLIVRGGVTILQVKDAAEVQMEEEPRKALAPKRISEQFYPPVPDVMPELNKGYLFNEERNLEVDIAAAEEPVEDLGVVEDVDFASVNYAGSVIDGKTKKGLVSYPAVQPQQRTKLGRIRRPPGRIASLAGGALEHATLQIGDVFAGMKVTEILPEKIVFEGDGETIEKFLFDPGKQRLSVPEILLKSSGGETKEITAKSAVSPATPTTPAIMTENKAGQVVQSTAPTAAQPAPALAHPAPAVVPSAARKAPQLTRRVRRPRQPGNQGSVSP